MPDSEAAQRRHLVEAARWLDARGLNSGTSGNIGLRLEADPGRMLVTPSAVEPRALAPEQAALMAIGDAFADEAQGGAQGGAAHQGPLAPTTEWRFHAAILLARPEIGAVVHTHAPWCTSLAMARRPIPAAHYTVALFGGTDVRCAPYATFGTAELARHAVQALDGRLACLLANHGMIACAPTLGRALWLAQELETLARQYGQCLALGGPVLLSDEQVADTAARFKGYGRRDDADG